MARIHPTAIVSKEAELASDVEIGPYSVVGAKIKIGAGTRVLNHVVLEGSTTIGERSVIFSGACLGTPPQDKKYKDETSFLEIGNDNQIREYVTMNPGGKEGAVTKIGDRNFIMIGSHIAHDCVLGNDITIANGTALAGHVTVEDHAVISGLVGVHQFVRIGKFSMVGGVSKVVMDVPPFAIYDGHPAKFAGVNVVGLRRAGTSAKDLSVIKKALKTLFASGRGLANAAEQVKLEFPDNAAVAHILSFIVNSERGVARSRSFVNVEE